MGAANRFELPLDFDLLSYCFSLYICDSEVSLHTKVINALKHKLTFLPRLYSINWSLRDIKYIADKE